MVPVVDAINEAAETDAPVLLEGEQGVGKEFVARLIHLSSYRQQKAFETLLPPALPADMAAEELFGLQARKLRQASGGTLLLKEVWRFPSMGLGCRCVTHRAWTIAPHATGRNRPCGELGTAEKVKLTGFSACAVIGDGGQSRLGASEGHGDAIYMT